MTPRTANPTDPDGQDSLVRRSWSALNPFSPSLLRRLPNLSRPVRYTRADAIPDTNADEDGLHPVVRDYHTINAEDGTRVGGNVRVPKKIATPVRVEAKVWFANERSELFFIAIIFLILIRFISVDILVELICSYWHSGIGVVQCFSRKPPSKVICLYICHSLRHCSGMFPIVIFHDALSYGNGDAAVWIYALSTSNYDDTQTRSRSFQCAPNLSQFNRQRTSDS